MTHQNGVTRSSNGSKQGSSRTPDRLSNNEAYGGNDKKQRESREGVYHAQSRSKDYNS